MTNHPQKPTPETSPRKFETLSPKEQVLTAIYIAFRYIDARSLWQMTDIEPGELQSILDQLVAEGLVSTGEAPEVRQGKTVEVNVGYWFPEITPQIAEAYKTSQREIAPLEAKKAALLVIEKQSEELLGKLNIDVKDAHRFTSLKVCSKMMGDFDEQ